MVTLEFTDGRALQRHKDNARLRTDDTETIIDRTKREIVEQQRCPEESEPMIDSPLNVMVPPLMPRQEAARKEIKEDIGEEGGNADEATHSGEIDKNSVGEDKVRKELQSPRRSTRVKRPVDIYQAGSSYYRRYIIAVTRGIEPRRQTTFIVKKC